MALSTIERDTLVRLQRRWESDGQNYGMLDSYYNGKQRVRQLGMAIPPSMRDFLVVANWPAVVVDTVVDRQQLRSLALPSEDKPDERLRDICDASNFDAQLRMFNIDRRVYGCSFFTVGSNEDDPLTPLIRAESPLEMAAEVELRHERVSAAARFYGEGERGGPKYATLYLPERTIWVYYEDGKWKEDSRDDHLLSSVPVVMHANRRRAGSMCGHSAMSDIIPLTDSAARTLTNLQFAVEAHGIPRMWMVGVAKGDFLDKDGKPIPKWEAYFNSIHTITDPSAKIGQLTPADLKNFETALDIYGRQASIVTGFPARYFGHVSANPPTEGSIRADEAQLIRTVETENLEVGITVGWVAALALLFANGERIPGNRIRADWFDPATPTIAQRMDAVIKAHAEGIITREGAWTEMSWSEARKEEERKNFAIEQADPVLTTLMEARRARTDAAAVGQGALPGSAAGS